MKVNVIVIRRLRWEDVDRLNDFVNRLSKEDTFVMLSGETVTREDQINYVVNSLLQTERLNKIHLIAVQNGQVLGNAEVRPFEKRKKHVGVVTIAIDQSARGQGLGTKLLKRLIEEAKRTHFRMLTLSSMENNVAGRAVYKKLGFVQVGIIPESFIYKGEYVGEVFYYLPLRKVLGKS